MKITETNGIIRQVIDNLEENIKKIGWKLSETDRNNVISILNEELKKWILDNMNYGDKERKIQVSNFYSRIKTFEDRFI